MLAQSSQFIALWSKRKKEPIVQPSVPSLDYLPVTGMVTVAEGMALGSAQQLWACPCARCRGRARSVIRKGGAVEQEVCEACKDTRGCKPLWF